MDFGTYTQKLKFGYQTGLTLIEIMITMAIISIVSAVAVPSYFTYVENSRVKPCTEEIAAIQAMQVAFLADNGTYFEGADIAAIQAASLNYYTPSPDFVSGNANCTLTIVAGPAGIGSQYIITATGANALAGKGVVAQVQNF